jgi:hypothetical protein
MLKILHKKNMKKIKILVNITYFKIWLYVILKLSFIKIRMMHAYMNYII